MITIFPLVECTGWTIEVKAVASNTLLSPLLEPKYWVYKIWNFIFYHQNHHLKTDIGVGSIRMKLKPLVLPWNRKLK